MVETKVKAATGVSYLAVLVTVALIKAVVDNPNILEGLPDWLEVLVLPVLPAVITFLGGYLAPHTRRPEVE